MAQWGYDLSNHNNTPNLDGWDFVIAKATEGNGFKDVKFRQHMDAAESKGLLRGAYHFLRSDSSVKEQVANFKSMVPLDIPAIPDVEYTKNAAGQIVSAPTLEQTRECHLRLLEAGYQVPLMYLPRWYWQFWGSPDLTGLPPLWLSWYPDYISRPRGEAFGLVPWSGKQPFGGITQAPIIQFTSSPLDQNYFDGTREELAALLGGGGGEDMTPEQDRKLTLIYNTFFLTEASGVVDPKTGSKQTVFEAIWDTRALVQTAHDDLHNFIQTIHDSLYSHITTTCEELGIEMSPAAAEAFANKVLGSLGETTKAAVTEGVQAVEFTARPISA